MAFYGENNPWTNFYGYQQPTGYPTPPRQQFDMSSAMPSQGGGMGKASGIGGLASGVLQVGFGIVDAIKQNKVRKQKEDELEQAVQGMPAYTESPIIRNLFSQAQSQANSTNPAIQALYNQQQQQAANVASAGQNYAQTGGEAIQAAIAGQQAANHNLPQIAQMQTDYNMQNRQNLNNASMALNNERQNVFNSDISRNDALQNLRAGQLRNATARWQSGWQNAIGGINAVGNAAGSLGGM